jgi:hypothetical protein
MSDESVRAPHHWYDGDLGPNWSRRGYVVASPCHRDIVATQSRPAGESPPSAVVQEGLVAEFASLREEIIARQGHQVTLFSLQLTLTGAILGYALSGPNRSLVLLVIPFSSFVLFGRYVASSLAGANIGRYIREELSPRVPGRLGWEQWIRDRGSHGYTMFFGFNPLLVAFPGVAVFALVGSLSQAVTLSLKQPLASAPIFLGWLAGALLTIVTIRNTLRVRRVFVLSDRGRLAIARRA